MKENKVPEKLYCCDKGNGNLFVDYRPFPNDESIEYTRTDAFMKKAKEGFCKAMCQGKPPRSTCTSLGTCKEYDEFIKAMKL